MRALSCLRTQDGEVSGAGDGARLVGAHARVLPLVGAPHGGHQQVARVEDLAAAAAVRAQAFLAVGIYSSNNRRAGKRVVSNKQQVSSQ